MCDTAETQKFVYVLQGDSLGMYYQFDTLEEAQAACGANQWVERVEVRAETGC